MEKKNKKKSLNKWERIWKNIKTWINENQKIVIGFGAGLLLGLLIMIITEDEEIAKLKDGTEPIVTMTGHTITADDLYKDMKDFYSVSILVNTIDNLLFEEKYPSTKEMETELENSAQNYYSTYESYYQMTKEQFLSNNGFASHEAFLTYLRLDYRRKEAVEDYVKEHLTDDEIKEYYDDKVYGEINTKHMLVKPATTDEMSDEEKTAKKDEALKLAKEIIEKLNSGKSFDEVKDEYKDQITYEELGFQAYNANLENAYKEEMKNLEVGKYSTKPVETSYGYHVVYKIEQKDKPKLEEVKDTVIDELYKEKETADTNLYYSTLFTIREESKLEFKDSQLEEKYKTFKSQYIK